MSNQVTDTFVDLWTNEVKQAYQQEEFLLQNAVYTKKGVKAATYKFPRMGAGEATYDKPRYADLVPMNVTHNHAIATLRPVHAMEFIDDVDALRTDHDLRGNYTKMILSALNRKLDEIVIAAMIANNSTPISGLVGLNKAGLAKATKVFDGLHIKAQDRYAAISDSGKEDILGDTTLTSRDYVTNKMLETGKVENVFGWNLIHFGGDNNTEQPSLLEDTGSGMTNLFWDKWAVGLAVGLEPTIMVERIPNKDGFQVMGKLLAGAVVIDANGVQEATIAD